MNMSGKKCVCAGIVCSVVVVLGISFWLNGAHSLKEIFVCKEALENTYYLMQIICSVVVIIGGVVGIWQYILAKKMEFNQYHNNRVQKAIDLAEYYKDHILCHITYIHLVYQGSGILDILKNVKREDMVDFDVQELKKNFSEEQRNEIKKITRSDKLLNAIIQGAEIFSKEPRFGNPVIIKEGEDIIEARTIKHSSVMDYFWNDIISEVLNNLEYFALHFNYETADKMVVYQSLHKTYLEMVRMLYYDIAINNESGEQRLYTNVIKLFNDWKVEADEQIKREVLSSRNNIIKGKPAKSID